MKKINISVLVIICSMSFLFNKSLAQKMNDMGSPVNNSKAESNTLVFDGIEDYVSIPNGTGIIAGLEAFSMCGWVYPSNTSCSWPDFDGYFGIKDEGVCDLYIVQLNGTSLEVRITTNSGQYTIPSDQMPQIIPNEWQHFAIVYTGSELQLFYNGVFSGSTPASGIISFENLEMTIGKVDYFETDFFLNGRVDEVTFWDKALTADEVSQYECISGDPSVVPDLIAYYNFNETSGLTLPDYFGSYNGILTNMSGEEWIESEVCQSGFDILFVVTDELTSEPVATASVNLDGVIKNTDSNGEAAFNNFDPGTYTYEITKTGYYESLGEVTVVDNDITVDVSLAPVIYYDITYLVTEDPGGAPVENAIVNMSGILQYTNETGQTIFTGFLPGSYPFIVIKEGYIVVFDTAVVIDQDLTENVSLTIVGINENFKILNRIFPNPVYGELTIELSDVTSETNITLINYTGKPIFHESMLGRSILILDLSHFPEGIYLLSSERDGIIETEKCLIKKVK
jgi:hypothetical protein